ncbi:cell wall metabolism sensor histidine kinase WalK [Actinomyces sp.]|uniref:sensor histidine kinase n=1 Tax=Actinomyces sp. TaxID=29317 RepID=UPI0026DD04D8|nr:HAMP domain-containing sensor histidine kinase [Actinomyces sp.]MDO4900134.1 HAMP domain-containing sensor histidine kinase [Actinomyces sp.]
MTAFKRAWRAQPLRSRLALITTGLLTVGLFASSLAVTSLLKNHLEGQVDDQLRTTAQTIGTQGLTALSSSRISNSEADASMPSTYYVEAQYLSGESGKMISPETAAYYGVPTIGTLSVAEAVAQSSDPKLFTVESNQLNHQWRVIMLPIDDRSTGKHIGVVAIALPLTGVVETVEQTRLVVALTDVSLILLGAMAAAYLVRRSFRTLRQIEGVAGQIASGDLSARVPVTEPPTTEVGSLQRALNTMLQQNEQAFDVQVVAQERMTRFVSDASHELRTPLAAIRGYGELYRMGGVPPERTPEVMGRIESEASRIGRLVDDLLQLARMDEGREMAMAPVDLTQIAAGALTDMMVLAPDRECALIPLDDADGEAQPAMVLGDQDRLSQVMTNLLGNVTRHTPDGSPVEIAVGTVDRPIASEVRTPSGRPRPAGPVPSAAQTLHGQTVVVEVRDHGPGVAPADAKKVFQRFYRADTSRNRETGGSGLGLAIVSAIIARHGGSVRMDQTPGGGATVHIELPALRESAAEPAHQ